MREKIDKILDKHEILCEHRNCDDACSRKVAEEDLRQELTKDLMLLLW